MSEWICDNCGTPFPRSYITCPSCQNVDLMALEEMESRADEEDGYE